MLSASAIYWCIEMASVELRPIDQNSLPAALALLARGFPERTEAFWRAGLNKILTMKDVSSARPAGVIITSDAKDIGILLTIPSERPDDDGTLRKVVNLVAWYVEESHRWMAARMLKKIVADEATVFLDLTPNPAAEIINQRLGFERLTDGFLIYLLPVTAFRPRHAAKVLSLDEAGTRLTAFERTTLRQHQALGCVVGVLRTANRYSPLVFSRMQRRGLPGARLILAESKAAVSDNLTAISRFLLRRKMLFLRMDVTRGDSAAGSMASRWNETTYRKGGGQAGERVDFTYSEFVFWGT